MSDDTKKLSSLNFGHCQRIRIEVNLPEIWKSFSAGVIWEGEWIYIDITMLTSVEDLKISIIATKKTTIEGDELRLENIILSRCGAVMKDERRVTEYHVSHYSHRIEMEYKRQ
ncbi:hypothetical protein ACFE04_004360 [Oxalis oulophora]